MFFVSMSSTLGRWLGLGNRDGSPKTNSTLADRASPQMARNPTRGSLAAPIPFPRFRATAGDQLGAADSAFARTRMKLLESFTPSQPVSDRKRFAGRLNHNKRAQ